jgi:hypothetical protein
MQDQGRMPAAVPAYAQPQRVTQARVLRSEWTKMRTQPSAGWALLSAAVLIIGFGILYSLLREARPPHGATAARAFDPAAVSLAGVQIAQIAAGVLGVLLITSEYASGLIRTSFAAVPRRLPVLWGKAALLAAATVAVSLPAAVAAFLAGQSILGRRCGGQLSRSRRSRSRTSPGFSALTRIIARTASARDTRGTSSDTAAASAHWVSWRYSSGLRSRVIRTGFDRMAVRPAGGASGTVRRAAAAAICALRCSRAVVMFVPTRPGNTGR